MIIIIVNNNGIYGGLDNETFKQIQSSGDPTQVYASLQFYYMKFSRRIVNVLGKLNTASRCLFMFKIVACDLGY